MGVYYGDQFAWDFTMEIICVHMCGDRSALMSPYKWAGNARGLARGRRRGRPWRGASFRFVWDFTMYEIICVRMHAHRSALLNDPMHIGRRARWRRRGSTRIPTAPWRTTASPFVWAFCTEIICMQMYVEWSALMIPCALAGGSDAQRRAARPSSSKPVACIRNLIGPFAGDVTLSPESVSYTHLTLPTICSV